MIQSTRPQQQNPSRPTVYSQGRRCNDCGCILSQYNRYNRCAPCRPERTELAPMTKQHEREQFLDAITELMEQT